MDEKSESLKSPSLARASTLAVESVPAVEHDIVLGAPSRRRFSVRGRIIGIRRGSRELALTDEDFDSIIPEAHNGATGLV